MVNVYAEALKKDNLRKVLEDIHTQSNSILSFSLQWKELEDHFDSVQKSILQRCEDLESKAKTIEERAKVVKLEEEKLVSLQESIEESAKEVELEKETLVSLQKAIEERAKDVGSKEAELVLSQKAIEERSVGVALIERELEGGQKAFKVWYQEFESEEKRLDSVRELIEERSREVDSRKRQLDLDQESIEERFKSIEQRSKELDWKEKRLNKLKISHEERSKAVELKEQQLQERIKEVQLHRQQFESRENGLEEEVELKDKELESREKQLEERRKGVELKEEQFESREKRLEERRKEVELKEQHFKTREKRLDECIVEVKLKEQQFEFREKQLEEGIKEVEFKNQQFYSREKQLEERIKEVELKEKRFNNIKTEPVDNGIISSANLRFCVTMDGISLQIFLNKHVKEHELMRNEVSDALQMSSDPAKLVLDAIQGFYPPHLKEGDVEFEASVVRRSCILLLEQLMEVSPKIKLPVKEEAMKVVGEWKVKMRTEVENVLEVLGFLLLLATYKLAPALDSAELLRLLQIVGHHRLVSKLSQALRFAKMIPMSGVLHSQVKIEQPEHSQVNNAINALSTNLSFCTSIDRSMGLRLSEFINDQNTTLEEVYDALQISSDPAKLVLDVLQVFFPLQTKKGNVYHQLCVINRCILLLQQLGRVSPDVKTQVKEAAMKLAVEWKATIRVETENSLEVVVLLQCLATYGLVTSFNGDEVFELLKTVIQHKQAAELCRALGFADKMLGYISILVQQKQLLVAVRYICAFELRDKFPPEPLLEAHVKASKTKAKRIRRNGSQSIEAHVIAGNTQIADLTAALRCVVDFKLKSKFSHEALKDRINNLSKEKAARIRAAGLPASKAQPQQDETSKSSPKSPVSLNTFVSVGSHGLRSKPRVPALNTSVPVSSVSNTSVPAYNAPQSPQKSENKAPVTNTSICVSAVSYTSKTQLPQNSENKPPVSAVLKTSKAQPQQKIENKPHGLSISVSPVVNTSKAQPQQKSDSPVLHTSEARSQQRSGNKPSGTAVSISPVLNTSKARSEQKSEDKSPWPAEIAEPSQTAAVSASKAQPQNTSGNKHPREAVPLSSTQGPAYKRTLAGPHGVMCGPPIVNSFYGTYPPETAPSFTPHMSHPPWQYRPLYSHCKPHGLSISVSPVVNTSKEQPQQKSDSPVLHTSEAQSQQRSDNKPSGTAVSISPVLNTPKARSGQKSEDKSPRPAEIAEPSQTAAVSASKAQPQNTSGNKYPREAVPLSSTQGPTYKGTLAGPHGVMCGPPIVNSFYGTYPPEAAPSFTPHTSHPPWQYRPWYSHCKPHGLSISVSPVVNTSKAQPLQKSDSPVLRTSEARSQQRSGNKPSGTAVSISPVLNTPKARSEQKSEDKSPRPAEIAEPSQTAVVSASKAQPQNTSGNKRPREAVPLSSTQGPAYKRTLAGPHGVMCDPAPIPPIVNSFYGTYPPEAAPSFTPHMI